jgi:hypothetical protein
VYFQLYFALILTLKCGKFVLICINALKNDFGISRLVPSPSEMRTHARGSRAWLQIKAPSLGGVFWGGKVKVEQLRHDEATLYSLNLLQYSYQVK